MKISLAQKDGIHILSVTGQVDMHNLTILKAGITKLFRDGRNRIGVDLSGAEQFDSDVIREIAILDILAREMAGRIALIVTKPELKQTLTAFSKPPIVPIFDDEEKLLAFFKSAPKVDTEDAGEDSKALKQQLKEKDREIELLRKRIEQMDPAELVKTKAEVATISGQYDALLKQMKDIYKERRVPTTPEIAADKARAMEAEVRELTDRLRGQTKGAP